MPDDYDRMKTPRDGVSITLVDLVQRMDRKLDKWEDKLDAFQQEQREHYGKLIDGGNKMEANAAAIARLEHNKADRAEVDGIRRDLDEIRGDHKETRDKIISWVIALILGGSLVVGGGMAWGQFRQATQQPQQQSQGTP